MWNITVPPCRVYKEAVSSIIKNATCRLTFWEHQSVCRVVEPGTAQHWPSTKHWPGHPIGSAGHADAHKKEDGAPLRTVPTVPTEKKVDSCSRQTPPTINQMISTTIRAFIPAPPPRVVSSGAPVPIVIITGNVFTRMCAVWFVNSHSFLSAATVQPKLRTTRSRDRKVLSGA